MAIVISLTNDMVDFLEVQAVMRYINSNELIKLGMPSFSAEIKFAQRYLNTVKKSKDTWWRERITHYIDTDIENKYMKLFPNDDAVKKFCGENKK